MATPPTYSIHQHHTHSLPTATIADRLAFARIRSGLAFADLSAPMHQHRETVSRTLASPLRMRADRLASFCSATSADPSWILYGDDPPPIVSLSGSTIGQRIHAYRTSLGLSTRAFASLCGLSQSSMVSAWETGRNVPLVAALMRLSDAMGINAAAFLPVS